MAMSLIFTCDQCGYSQSGWSDGSPYIEHPKGKRNYFYHPGGESILKRIAGEILGHEPSPDEMEQVVSKYVGNAPSHICRGCEKVTQIDTERDGKLCPHCGSAEIENLYRLAGKKCIKCPGKFSEGEMGAVS